MPRNNKNAAAKKSVIRKTRAESKRKPSKKTTPKAAKMVKGKTPPQPQQKSTGANRAAGIRLFRIAGRPTREQFILVYGPTGPRLTWQQRAEAGVPAERFQAVLAEKTDSRRTTAK